MESEKLIKSLMEESQELINTFIEFQEKFNAILVKYLKARRIQKGDIIKKWKKIER